MEIIVFIILFLVFTSIIAIGAYIQRRRISLLYESLKQAKEELEKHKASITVQNKDDDEDAQLKYKLFTTISHEFRTPLTLIIGSIDKISEASQKEDKTATQQYLQTLKRNSQLLLRLFNQVINYQEIEAKSMNLNTSKANMVKFIENICAAFDSLAKHYHIGLIYEPKIDSLDVWFDADKIENIIYTLISNSLNYTPEGGAIKISVYLEKIKIPEFYCITIENTGLGIPEDEVDKIFEPFYQPKIPQIRKYENTGIGLSLVKSMVQIHFGEINVKSSVKESADTANSFNTCYVIKLPLNNPNLKSEDCIIRENETSYSSATLNDLSHTKKQNLLLSPESSTEKPKQEILIVEDNEELLQFVFDSLEDNYSVLTATNGADGFEIAVRHIPDLIISDIMMPLMNGMELCQKLKKDLRTSHIPVVLLTARTSEEHKIEGYECGADDYISKPFTMSLLNVRIRNLIETRRALRKSFGKEISIQPTNKLITSVDANFLEKVIAIIEENIEDSNFDVETLSKEVGISSRHLLNKIQNLTNSTPVELIRTIRLKRAEQLLLLKKSTIAEIAYEVGFSDPNYFSKCFAKMYGKTPKEYMDMKQNIDN